MKAELRLLQEMATLNDELQSLKQELKGASRRKTTKRKVTRKKTRKR